MKKRIISILCILALIFTIPTGATSLEDKKDDLQQTEDKIENNEAEIKEKEEEIKIAEQEVAGLDQEIVDVEREIAALNQKLSTKEAQIEEAEKELEIAIFKKDTQYQATKERMVSMYKNSNMGYLELIFSASNLSELLTRVQYAGVIANYDNQLIDDYKEQERVIVQQKEVLDQEKEVLDGLHREQLAMQESLESKKHAKTQMIANLAKEQSVLEAEVAALEKEYKDLQDEIAKLIASSNLQYTGGPFVWPVTNHYYISSGYTHRINPVTGIPEFHKGIDIPAPYGTSVVAVADGKVIASGSRGTFGNTVILDHGSGLTTLYAHNSTLDVRVGEMVSAGQRIAGIGSTGRSTGNHLHFEVHINNQHTSPWNYLKK